MICPPVFCINKFCMNAIEKQSVAFYGRRLCFFIIFLRINSEKTAVGNSYTFLKKCAKALLRVDFFA